MVIYEIGRAPVGDQDVGLLITIQIGNGQVAGILGSRTNGLAEGKLPVFLPELDTALLPVIGNGHIHQSVSIVIEGARRVTAVLARANGCHAWECAFAIIIVGSVGPSPVSAIGNQYIQIAIIIQIAEFY